MRSITERHFLIVKHIDIGKVLEEMGNNGKDLRVLENLYWNQMAAISINGELNAWTHIKRCMRQGCIVSLDLFSLYA